MFQDVANYQTVCVVCEETIEAHAPCMIELDADGDGNLFYRPICLECGGAE